MKKQMCILGGLCVIALLAGCTEHTIVVDRETVLQTNLFVTDDDPPPTSVKDSVSDSGPTTSNNNPKKDSWTLDGPGLNGHLPVKYWCSNHNTNQSQTNVVVAEGVTVHLFEVDSLSDKRLTNHIRSIGVDDEKVRQKIQKNLLDAKKLSISTTDLVPDKMYSILLCDAHFPDCPKHTTMSRGLLGSVTFGTKTDVIQLSSDKKPEVISTPEEVNVTFFHNQQDMGCDGYASPLMVDLDQDGIMLTPPTEGILFPILSPDTLHAISWPKYDDDALLTLPDKDGLVSNINELFGDNTVGPDGRKAANGFEALKKHDLNHDSVIDVADDVYADLRLWTDLDKDGVSKPSELHTLASKGIAHIDLAYVASDEVDVFQNQTRQRSTVTLANGDLRLIFDIWFRPLPREAVE